MAKFLLTVVASLATVWAVGCTATPPVVKSSAGTTEPVTIVRHITGHDAGFKTLGVKLVNSKAELQALGSKELVAKDVNFAKESLIVLMLGECKTGGYWATITGVQQQGDVLFVQGISNKPAGAAAGGLTYPYDAVVAPKLSAKTLHPEIDSVIGQKPFAAAAK